MILSAPRIILPLITLQEPVSYCARSMAIGKIIDEIIARKLPLYTYKKESTGPQQAQEFAQKYGIRWKL